MASPPRYVNSPGAGPFSLRSLTAPKPKRPVAPKAPAAKPKPLLPKAPVLGPKPPVAAPLTDTQLAQQQLDPLIAAITNGINQRARLSGQNIVGVTSSLAQQLAGMNFGSPYQQAVPQQAAVDEALRASLSGQGASLSQGLQSKLAQLQEPNAVNPTAQGVANFGTGTGNTALAGGSAALSNLLANQAAANEYGQKLPGIAQQGGLQNLARLQAQALQAISDQTGQVEAKLPDLVNQIQGNRFEQQKFAYQQAQDAAANALAQKKYAAESALAQKKYGLDVAKAKASVSQGNARVNIAAQNAATAQQRLSLEAGHWQDLSNQAWTKIGISKKNLQLRAKALDKKQANGGFTVSQLNKFNSTAYGIAKDALNGYTDGKGNPIAPRSYSDALDWMIRSGVPPSIATKYLNATYPETKRPITAQTRADYNQMTGVGHKATPFDVANLAKQYLGVPYKWGGTSTSGMDCSAFVQSVYKRLGVNLPRTTYDQVKYGAPVALNQLQPGDAIFTRPGKNGPNHVGLYVGNGVVQESPHTGDVNKLIPLRDYLSGGFVAARRYLGG